MIISKNNREVDCRILKRRVKSTLHLYIFYDDVEEILVAAKDRDDAFNVVDEAYAPYKNCGDNLILSRLSEYPHDFVFPKGNTAKWMLKKLFKRRRGLIQAEPGTFVKPEKR